MEPDCKALIDKYVRSDSVIACLELSGYTSALLIRNLDSHQIDQIEEFVRHACTVMNPNQSRNFLGNVFSCHADKFCFPIGVRMGLMLAVNELKSLSNHNTSLSTSVVKSVDKSIQTDISIGCSFSSFLNPNLHFFNKLTAPNSVICDQPQLRFAHDLSSSSTPKSSIDQASDGMLEASDLSNQQKPPTATGADNSDISVHVNSHYNSSESPPEQRRGSNNNSGSSNNNNANSTNSMSLFQQSQPHHHDINIDHLKQHSSASAVRLAARQFLNASLVANRHFRIDMEVSATGADGPPRVTGIFHCHLCRQKRDRSTPVRFSIARNRYPVMSNVLSHLKIHFQPLLSSPPSSTSASASSALAAAVSSPLDSARVAMDSHATRFIKQEHLVVYSSGGQSDSSGVGVDSLSPFNLDHLIMAGGGGVAGAFGVDSEMKMFPSGGGCGGLNE